jgi:hypothetical protein
VSQNSAKNASVPAGPAGGDLGGDYPDPSVNAINGVVVTGTPTAGQVLKATSSSAADWQTLATNTLPITFQPSGTAHSNVFVTEAALNTAVLATFGAQTVYVDLNQCSGAYTTTTALNIGEFLIGVPFANNGLTPVLTLGNTVTIYNFGNNTYNNDAVEIRDIRLKQQSGPNFAPLQFLRLTGDTVIYSNDSSGLYNVPPIGGGSYAVLEAFDQSVIGEGLPVINVGSATLNIYLNGSSTLNAGALTISGGTVNIYVNSASATVDTSYIGMSGIAVYFNSSVVFNGGASGVANIMAGRPTNQSPITAAGTLEGVVNFGSDTTGITTGASANFATISGGDQNVVSGIYGVIGGGILNNVSGQYSSVVGGDSNIANGNEAFVGGGVTNYASGQYSVVCGGQANVAGGYQSAIGGGFGNIADGQASACFGYGNNVTSYAFATGSYNDVSGAWGVAHGYGSLVPRFGQFGLTSSGTNLYNIGDSQSNVMTLANVQSTVGSPFYLLTAGFTEFSAVNQVASANQYYSMNIRIIAMARNAAVGPVTFVWEVLMHTASGNVVIDSAVQMLASPAQTDPYGTGWTSSITAPGGMTLRISIDPGADATNTLNGMAELKWAEISGFQQ